MPSNITCCVRNNPGGRFFPGSEGKDSAMLAEMVSRSVSNNPGGIDLNPDLLKLLVRGDSASVNILSGNGELEDVRIKNGLVPVIVAITLVTNLTLILSDVN